MTSYLLSLAPWYFSLAFAAQEAKSEPGRPVIAQVRLHDGSVVKVALLQETISIQTAYGKLAVPTADIRRIDFGLHMPKGAEEQIAGALKKLGSDTYRDREEAVREIVQHYADRLAHHARNAPYNWFNFYDFWHSQSNVRRDEPAPAAAADPVEPSSPVARSDS